MDKAREIAKGLTKAQRALLLAVPECGIGTAEEIARAAGYDWRKLREDDWPGFSLMHPTLTDPPGEILTAKGLAVRAALQEG